jgi:hypothetical protein
MAPEKFKVTVRFERREDAGLRAWSPDLPGLVLSNANPAKVEADVQPALETMIGARCGCQVLVEVEERRGG